jgi:hypothetical protein
MSMSTASRDLAAIKRAVELVLILAAFIIATIMIVTAAHDDARKLTSDITTGQVMFTPAFRRGSHVVKQFGAPVRHRVIYFVGRSSTG